LTRCLQQQQVRSVLDVGCGSGTHLALLEQQGFQVEGVDLNEAMLQVARGKVKGSLHQSDMAHLSLSKTFDAILCLFAAFNHNLKLEGAQQTLHRFSQHLNPQCYLPLGSLHYHPVYSASRHNPSRSLFNASFSHGRNA